MLLRLALTVAVSVAVIDTLPPALIVLSCA